MAEKREPAAGGRKPVRQEADVGGNEPRGDRTGFPEIGEGGGPGGVEPRGGPPPANGVPLGMTPGDLQKSPEEIVDEWTEE
jgi:hypothetical protein